jgi:ArsR family transcriptional regulator, lead/cadmium/zinc/bismuth-responsive transcriptional repressor
MTELNAENSEFNIADDDTCEITVIHPDKLNAVRDIMPPEADILMLTEMFKSLSDPTRTKILFALSHNELCVCDLAELLGLTMSAVSHQLRLLRNTRIVTYRKEGKKAFYSLTCHHVKGLFQQGLDHVQEVR